MNVVDSSGWLVYFAGEANSSFFAPAIEDTEQLIVPAISLCEVLKRIHQQRGADAALRAVSAMMQGQVVDLNTELALSAATSSLEQKLPMADSIILATARAHAATLWTQDADFSGMEGVEYREKQ